MEEKRKGERKGEKYWGDKYIVLLRRKKDGKYLEKINIFSWKTEEENIWNSNCLLLNPETIPTQSARPKLSPEHRFFQKEFSRDGDDDDGDGDGDDDDDDDDLAADSYHHHRCDTGLSKGSED